MKISVIIPTYKPGDYIWDCFQSLQNQSCSSDSFEVVVVLNGDKEPYYGKIENYLKNSKLHFKLIFTHEKGVSNARNVGIDYAQSKQADYILFLDDDDMLSSSFIADCLSKANPNQIVVCNSKTFRNTTDNVFGEDYISRCYNRNKDKKYNIFNYRCFFSSVCAKLIPVRIIGDTRFDTRFKIGEDSLFGFAISKNIDKCILAEEESIYFRRIRQGSASRSKPSLKFKLKNYSRLIVSYTRIYFSDIREYNFLFFISRIIASLIQSVKCI